MNDKEFKWTDADMREWGAYYAVQSSSETDFNLFRHFEKFKELKPNNEYSQGNAYPLYTNKYLEELNASIYSVKRLSDNEVFTIGDKCKAIMWDFVISSFEVKGSYVTIYAQGGGYCYLDKNLIKATLVPLFTTEDLVPIFKEEETVWVVDTEDFACWSVNAKSCGGGNKYFSTADAANTFILMNKPCLSLQEVMFWLSNHLQEHTIKSCLRQLAERKINNNATD